MPAVNLVTQQQNADIRQWIKGRDFFWLRELKEAFGCLHDTDSRNPMTIRISQVLGEMRKTNEIQCTEKRGAERQYYVTGN